jgi:hypothetical protein
MFPIQIRLALLGGAASAALVLGACSDGTTTPTGGANLTAAQTADIGTAAVDETNQAVDALDVGVATNPASFMSSASASTPQHVAADMPPLGGCATVSSTQDTDGDGARDQSVYTYDPANCTFTGYRGGTLVLSGTITISDPTPDVPDFNYAATLADFTWNFTAPAGDVSFVTTRNGTRHLTASASALTLTNDVTAVRKVTGKADATISHNLQLDFTPAQGSTLAPGQPLPSGTIVKSGQVSWARGTASYTFTANTVTPLSYDATCTQYPRYLRITAGEVHWTLASGAYIRTVWSACGQRPTHTFVPAS